MKIASYSTVEDDDTQCDEITDATETFPITGASPPVFPHHVGSAQDAETTASNSIPATGESSRGTHCNQLRDRRPLIRYS